MELAGGLSTKKVRAFLKDALVVPVITAHPTEVRRKSILDRETEIGELGFHDLGHRPHALKIMGAAVDVDQLLQQRIGVLLVRFDGMDNGFFLGGGRTGSLRREEC